MLKGNSQLSLQSLREAIALARSLGDKRLLGLSLEIYYTAGSFTAVPDGPAAAEEGFAIFNEIDDVWGRSTAYMNMARIAAARGDYETSRKYFDLLNTRLKATPVSFMTGITFLAIGYIERDQSHLDIARQHFEEGLKVFKFLRHKGFETVMLSELGHNARAQGDMAQARRIYRETITNFQDFGNRGAISHQLECFAFIALSEADPGRAVKLFAAASALRDKINALRTELEQAEYDRAIAQLHLSLAETVFDPLWAEGRAMTMEEAIQLALS
jgi:tetratricopeptide (TPR) repeat protein